MLNNEILTVREVANKCKVSRQTIYNIVKELEENEADTGLITVKEGVKHFTPKGQAYIMDRLNISKDTKEEATAQNKSEKEQDIQGQDYKDKYIKMLEAQIKIKDEQIQGLNIAIQEIQQRQKEVNILQAMEKKQLSEPKNEYKEPQQDERKEETKGIINRLKNLFK